MNTLTKDIEAIDVSFDEDSMCVHLSDGRSISTPLAWYPRLYHGTTQERNKWQIIGKGSGIHWPQLDEDLSVESIILGRPSMEKADSLKKWLESRTA
ncbi:MAG: DUF2442 domain-containing protein [Cyclobacteriaceae bacterium]